MVRGVAGTWKDLTDNVNSMANNLTGQVRNIAEVTTAVANGDLSKKITVDVRGEISELKNTINTMMPEMDGIATMKEIRKLQRGKNLPIVAVTAKAMKGDREKCIEAGAWDYLSKPVDTAHMLVVLRSWLCR